MYIYFNSPHLLQANTYNVERSGPQGGLEMDDVQLKLLSMDRYHEHLDNFCDKV